MNKCDPFYCKGLKKGHIFWCHTFWGGRAVRGQGGVGVGEGDGRVGGGDLDVLDKGSHFLVSHFLGLGCGWG